MRWSAGGARPGRVYQGGMRERTSTTGPEDGKHGGGLGDGAGGVCGAARNVPHDLLHIACTPRPGSATGSALRVLFTARSPGWCPGHIWPPPAVCCIQATACHLGLQTERGAGRTRSAAAPGFTRKNHAAGLEGGMWRRTLGSADADAEAVPGQRRARHSGTMAAVPQRRQRGGSRAVALRRLGRQHGSRAAHACDPCAVRAGLRPRRRRRAAVPRGRRPSNTALRNASPVRRQCGGCCRRSLKRHSVF